MKSCRYAAVFLFTVLLCIGGDAFGYSYQQTPLVISDDITTEDVGIAVGADSQGNVYVAAIPRRAVASTPAGNGTITKYSTTGTLLWRVDFDPNNPRPATPGSQGLRALVVDAQDNVYVTGESYNGTNLDCLLKKFDTNGQVVWQNRYNENQNEYCHDIALAPDGTIVTGGTINGNNYILIRWDANGNILSSGSGCGSSPCSAVIAKMDIDSSGNIYAIMWDGYGKLLVKYASSLTPIASSDLPSTVYSNSHDLAVNAEGTVFIAGVEILSGPSGSTYSQRLSVYDSNLSLICEDVRDYLSGGYNDDGAYAVALGANGHAFVAGAENRMFSVMEYDSQCLPQWSDASGNPSPLLLGLADRDIAYDVALDTQGNLLITGTSGLLDEFVILRENTTVLRYARNLPDLAFTAASGPTSANTCQQITVTGTLSNQGQDSTGTAPPVNLYLSSDASITTGDTYLGGITLNPMEPGTLQSFSITATIPTTTSSGAYYLGLLADPALQIIESSETNNTRALPITITRVYPDLVVTSVSGPTSGRVGRQVTVTTTVKNQGACATGNSFMVDLRLSSDTTINSADALLSTVSVTAMNAGEQRTISTPVTLRSTGTYYFGAIADSTNVIAESSETNNTRAGNRIKISK